MNAAKPICLNSEAFYELLDQVVEHITDTYKLDKAERWISIDECMTLLNVKSRTTIWELKTKGKISFSQISSKIVLFDRHSVLDYIASNKREAF
jgi:predicted DNA-binding transcriptional regulator AlpA